MKESVSVTIETLRSRGTSKIVMPPSPRIIHLSRGVAQVLGFVEAGNEWLRIEFQVTRERARLRAVACCGPDDFSAHEPIDGGDQRCDDCSWLSAHTVLLHDRATGRLLS